MPEYLATDLAVQAQPHDVVDVVDDETSLVLLGLADDAAGALTQVEYLPSELERDVDGWNVLRGLIVPLRFGPLTRGGAL